MKIFSKKGFMFFLLAVAAFLSVSSPVWAKDPRIHGFTLIVRGNNQNLSAIDKEYVSAEDLGKVFGASLKSIEGGKSVMAEYLYYDKDVRAYKGKAYVKAATFFDFFGMPYKTINLWSYGVDVSFIPLFYSATHRFEPNGSVKIADAPVTVGIVTVRNRKFVELEPIAAKEYLTPKIDGGKLTLGGKRIDRWLGRDGKTYVLFEDLKTVVKKPIK